MPLYLYEVIEANGELGERFEIFQKMTDAPLALHPHSGEPVRSVIRAPAVPRNRVDVAAKQNVADDNRLEKLGFTKYVKTKDGYEKRAGQGPDKLSRDRIISGDDLS